MNASIVGFVAIIIWLSFENINAQDLLTTQFLERVNHYRRIHQAEPLRYAGDRATQYEQEFLPQKIADGIFFHQPIIEVIARNRYFVSTRDLNYTLSAETIVDTWYAERFDYESYYGFEPWPGEIPKFANFTQMVWRDSKVLTVIRYNETVNKELRVYLQCLIEPGGNKVGGFAKNVKENNATLESGGGIVTILYCIFFWLVPFNLSLYY